MGEGDSGGGRVRGALRLILVVSSITSVSSSPCPPRWEWQRAPSGPLHLPSSEGRPGRRRTDGRTDLHVSSTPVMSAVSLSPTQRPDGQTHYLTLRLTEEQQGPEMTHSRGFVLFSVFASLARNSHARHNVIFLFPQKALFFLLPMRSCAWQWKRDRRFYAPWLSLNSCSVEFIVLSAVTLLTCRFAVVKLSSFGCFISRRSQKVEPVPFANVHQKKSLQISADWRLKSTQNSVSLTR